MLTRRIAEADELWTNLEKVAGNAGAHDRSVAALHDALMGHRLTLLFG